MSEELPLYGGGFRMPATVPQRRDDVKSDEEWQMVLWLRDAVGAYLVHGWEYEPQSFVLFPPEKYTEIVHLKTKSKIVERTLHQGASYTPDFAVRFTEDGKRFLLCDSLKKSFATAIGEAPEIYIDIKGAFNPNDQPRYFSVIQKAVYHIHGIWVSRVVPFHKTKAKAKGLFVETFAPEKVRWKLNGRELNHVGRSCVTVQQIVGREL